MRQNIKIYLDFRYNLERKEFGDEEIMKNWTQYENSNDFKGVFFDISE